MEFDDEASVRRALTGAWGAYAVQNTWTAGVEREEEQGHRFARAAKATGIQHFVYASVASAHRQTGIPHFDNKFRVENTVRGLGFPSYTIIRPVYFMENLLSPIPISEVRKSSPDAAAMYEWFERVGFDADIAGNARTYGVRPTTLGEWAARRTAMAVA